MKLVHEVNLEVDNRKLSIKLRDLKKSEVKSLESRHESLSKEVEELKFFEKKAKRLESKLKRLESKEKYLEGEALLKIFEEQEAITLEIQEMEDNAEKINLTEINEKVESIYKDRLGIACSGEGKEEIMQIGADYGYKRIWEALTEAAIEAEKKQ